MTNAWYFLKGLGLVLFWLGSAAVAVAALVGWFLLCDVIFGKETTASNLFSVLTPVVLFVAAIFGREMRRKDEARP
jgi:hypothetical protein